MPTYDLHCAVCQVDGIVFCKMDDRDKQICRCGELMKVKISIANYIPFHGGWYENIAANPIYIKSKRHLQHECQKRGLTSLYAEGSKFSEV